MKSTHLLDFSNMPNLMNIVSAVSKRLWLILALIVWLLFAGIYWVGAGYTAVLVKWGEPQIHVKTKGLHWRIPFVERVYVIDQRNQLLKIESLNVAAADKNQIVLSGFVLWRVTDPLKYYEHFLMSMQNGDKWFSSEMSALLSGEVASHVSWDFLLTHTVPLREKSLLLLREKAKNKGVDVIDVGFLDINVSQDIQHIIFDNMREANQQQMENVKKAMILEARGIHEKADAASKALLLKAQQDSLALTQSAEKESLNLLLKAYRQDPAFYVYYHRLKAYKQLLSEKDHWVVSPKDDFFKYLTHSDVSRH